MKELENKIKKDANNASFEFKEEYWDAALVKLKEAERKAIVKRFFWILLFAVLIGGATYFTWDSFTGTNNSMQNNNGDIAQNNNESAQVLTNNKTETEINNSTINNNNFTDNSDSNSHKPNTDDNSNDLNNQSTGNSTDYNSTGRTSNINSGNRSNYTNYRGSMNNSNTSGSNNNSGSRNNSSNSNLGVSGNPLNQSSNSGSQYTGSFSNSTNTNSNGNSSNSNNNNNNSSLNTGVLSSNNSAVQIGMPAMEKISLPLPTIDLGINDSIITQFTEFQVPPVINNSFKRLSLQVFAGAVVHKKFNESIGLNLNLPYAGLEIKYRITQPLSISTGIGYYQLKMDPLAIDVNYKNYGFGLDHAASTLTLEKSNWLEIPIKFTYNVAKGHYFGLGGDYSILLSAKNSISNRIIQSDDNPELSLIFEGLIADEYTNYTTPYVNPISLFGSYQFQYKRFGAEIKYHYGLNDLLDNELMKFKSIERNNRFTFTAKYSIF